MAADASPAGHDLRRLASQAALLAGLFALAATARFWREDPYELYLARGHYDSFTILNSARAATARQWLGWWTGSWIESGTPYYRPLTSTLIGLEWRLFGGNVLGFCAVGWVLHGVNAALLFLLAWRLFRGSARRRLLMGIAAAAAFTLPTSTNHFAALADVIWWPAQTDVLSLTFSLASLLALDRALARPGPVRLGLPLVLFALALLSKEMAVILPVPAALLAATRRRDWRPVLLGYLALAAVLLWVRFFAVPGAMGPEWKPRHLFGKALTYVGGETGALLNVGMYWLPLAAAVLLWGGWLLHKRRVEAPWVFVAALVTVPVLAQVFGASWASLFEPRAMRSLVSCFSFFAGAWLLALSRREQPVVFVAGSLVAIHLPILHVGGVHYLYWPAAFWGLVYAVILARAADLACRACGQR